MSRVSKMNISNVRVDILIKQEMQIQSTVLHVFDTLDEILCCPGEVSAMTTIAGSVGTVALPELYRIR